jgi:ABC-type transport system involved in multi-copper enzyme maturation permease subunit
MGTESTGAGIAGLACVALGLLMVTISLAKSFGKSSGFGIGLLLLGVVFFPMLAFGNNRYIGPTQLSTT